MAGCRPEYRPVIVAAVEGLLVPAYPLEFMQVTTNPMTPFLLVNGDPQRAGDHYGHRLPGTGLARERNFQYRGRHQQRTEQAEQHR